MWLVLLWIGWKKGGVKGCGIGISLPGGSFYGIIKKSTTQKGIEERGETWYTIKKRCR